MAKKRKGRPLKSIVRQRIANILSHLGSAYGYQIYQLYVQVYPPVTMRNIYYHLNKGVQTNEFEVEVKEEKGDYSWGSEVERKYFRLGPNAKTFTDDRIQKLLDQQKNTKKSSKKKSKK